MRLFISTALVAGGLVLAVVLAACAAPLTINSEPERQATQVVMDKTSFLNIAHRGARSLAPENTMLAARKALELGASGWELDVAMTSDNELVVIHDDTLERTSDAAQVYPGRYPWAVGDFSLEELRRLDFGSWYPRTDPFGQIAAGAVSLEEQAAMEGTPIPTLREALEFTQEHSWWVNVEIKDASRTPADTLIVEGVVALIQELGMGENVLISSFNHDYLRQVKAIQPGLATGALVSDSVDDPLSLLVDLGAQAYHPSRRAVRPEQVQALRQAGYAVYVWTVNEEDEMRALIAMGVSGVFTDYPQRLKELLK